VVERVAGVLGKIAARAKDLKIAALVRTAASQSDDMIEVIVVTDFVAAVGALAALRLENLSDIRGAKETNSVLLQCAASVF